LSIIVAALKGSHNLSDKPECDIRGIAVEERLKQRLTGAVVLILAGVVFIPILLNNPDLPEMLRKSIKQTQNTGAGNREPSAESPEPTVPTENNTINLAEAEAVEIEPITENTSSPTPVKSRHPLIAKAPASTPPAPKSPREDVAEPKSAITPALLHGEKVGVAAWVIQLGSFSSEENAVGLVSQLKSRGFANAFAEKLYAKHGKVFRVRVGPELLEAKARQVQARIEREINLKGIVVKYP
jgi:DedD protein